MRTYFNIRVIKGRNSKHAIKRIQNESDPFHTEHVMCDKVYTKEALIKELTSRKMDYNYFIFGEDIAKIYHNGATKKELAANIDQGNGELCKISKTADPIRLLEAYDGWNGYAIITKEEYEELSKMTS